MEEEEREVEEEGRREGRGVEEGEVGMGTLSYLHTQLCQPQWQCFSRCSPLGGGYSGSHRPAHRLDTY